MKPHTVRSAPRALIPKRPVLATLAGTALSLFASASFGGAPHVSRPAPFPHYLVGQTATLTIQSSPVQAQTPIYGFRYKNGQPDGPQPALVGYTDDSGRYSISATVQSEWVGSYTNERFAVGSPTAPKSSPLNFTISASTGGTIGIFYLGECHGCTSQQQESRAVERASSFGRSGTHHIVLYDALHHAHSELLVEREYLHEIDHWVTWIWEQGAPGPALTAAIDDYFAYLKTFDDNLRPFAVAGDGISKNGEADCRRDFDSMRCTLDLHQLQVEGEIESIAAMSSVFLRNLSDRLIELGHVPEIVLGGQELIGRESARSSEIARMEGSSTAASINPGVAFDLGVVEAELKGSRTDTTLERITDSQGVSIGQSYRVHSRIRVRIRIDDPDALEDGHMIVRFDGEAGRFLLEAATGPGGSRLPFDENGNLTPPLVANPVLTIREDVVWWHRYSGLFGVVFGECEPTGAFWCRLYRDN